MSGSRGAIRALNKDCIQAMGQFLDYSSFCAARLCCRSFWQLLRFDMCFRDWVGAIGTLTDASQTRQMIEEWMKSEKALFCIPFAKLRNPLVCKRFVPHPFQNARCRECKYMDHQHVHVGGRLVTGTVQQNTVPVSSFAGPRELYCNLRTSLRYAYHIQPIVLAECSRLGNGERIDYADCDLFAPVVIEDGRVVSLGLMVSICGENFGFSEKFTVPSCPLIEFDNLG
jgi:hypothetical protein